MKISTGQLKCKILRLIITILNKAILAIIDSGTSGILLPELLFK